MDSIRHLHLLAHAARHAAMASENRPQPFRWTAEERAALMDFAEAAGTSAEDAMAALDMAEGDDEAHKNFVDAVAAADDLLEMIDTINTEDAATVA